VGVQKFRSIEEMNRSPVPITAGRAFERFLRHCARYWIIAPRTYPRGCSGSGPSKKLRLPAIASQWVRVPGAGSAILCATLNLLIHFELRTYLLVSEAP